MQTPSDWKSSGVRFSTFCIMKKMEYIRIRDWPPDHAYEAYKRGYFVEAIQVLHGYIENQAFAGILAGEMMM